ncbi:MAG: BTAD domain-containing putative transcriptional regulator, partial [Bacillota bacterium]|nr:BTAD domain-containing putative transcriptional regulator [Bacillota bacterium]
MLQLGLMGRPYVVGPHGPVLLSTRKGEALLWYLAAQPEKKFTRSHLAGLLWEGSYEPSARRTLTTVLVTLRRALPAFPLHVTREVLSWDPDAHVQLDIMQFCREAGIEGPQTSTLHERDEKQLAAALALRRGPFLDGFSVPDSAEYQVWLEQQRHLWDRRVLVVLERLAGLAEAARNWEALASHSRAALAIDPLQESFHR